MGGPGDYSLDSLDPGDLLVGWSGCCTVVSVVGQDFFPRNSCGKCPKVVAIRFVPIKVSFWIIKFWVKRLTVKGLFARLAELKKSTDTFVV